MDVLGSSILWLHADTILTKQIKPDERPRAVNPSRVRQVTLCYRRLSHNHPKPLPPIPTHQTHYNITHLFTTHPHYTTITIAFNMKYTIAHIPLHYHVTLHGHFFHRYKRHHTLYLHGPYNNTTTKYYWYITPLHHYTILSFHH